MDSFENFKTSLSYYYKVLKYKESEPNTDPFLKASLKRKCLSQIGKLTSLTNNQDSCHLLNENLKRYADVVDDKTTINNYAEQIQALTKTVKNDSRLRWRSSLQVTENTNPFCPSSKADEAQQRLEYSCINSSCQATKEDVKLLLLAKDQMDNMSLNADVEDHTGNRENIVPFFPNANNKRKCDSLLNNVNENAVLCKNMRTEERPSSGTSNNWPTKVNMQSQNFNSVANRVTQKQFNPSSGDVSRPSNSFSASSVFAKPLQPQQRGGSSFRTASDELKKQNVKKYGSGGGMSNSRMGEEAGYPKKSLGGRSRSVMNRFVPPIRNSDNKEMYDDFKNENDQWQEEGDEEDERLKHIDPKMIELIRSEIMDCGAPITWDDIAGLQFAKKTIQEIVVWPMLRPDIFTGLRRPPKGILLFGPPGTGKTLIGKCIASQSTSTFFSISASSLTSKWIGDGEKMVRALFTVARVHQPSVVFIDEIDSLLSKRSDSEHESSRRIKTEFLVQLDGATTGDEDRILVVGATNRPQELDEAARRRLVKRLYIPLPDCQARMEIVSRLMSKERNNINPEDIAQIAELMDGYSGADVRNVCQEAALGPIRAISMSQIEHIAHDQVQPIRTEDFKAALNRVRSSVSPSDLVSYLEWDKTYGSGSI